MRKISKKWFSIVFVGVLILLTVPFMSCVETATPSTTTPIVTQTDQQQNTRLDNIEKKNTQQDTDIANLGGGGSSGISQEDYNNMISRLNSLETAKSKHETDISNLKKDVADLKDNGVSGDNGDIDGDFGSLVDTDGDLKLYLDYVMPSEDPIYLREGGDSARFGLVVVNEASTSNRYKITLVMTPDDAVAVCYPCYMCGEGEGCNACPDEYEEGDHEEEQVCSEYIACQYDTEIDSYPNNGFNWTITRTSGVWCTSENRGSLYFEMDSASGQYIGKHDYDDLELDVTIEASDDARWDYKFYIYEID